MTQCRSVVVPNLIFEELVHDAPSFTGVTFEISVVED